MSTDLDQRCTEISDKVVPQYRSDTAYTCTSWTVKRWQAAWEGACIALSGKTAPLLALPNYTQSPGEPT